MANCEVCGNDYDQSFQVTMAGKSHTFDSFECAIHALAPTCEHCGVRIAGHGLEKNGRIIDQFANSELDANMAKLHDYLGV